MISARSSGGSCRCLPTSSTDPVSGSVTRRRQVPVDADVAYGGGKAAFRIYGSLAQVEMVAFPDQDDRMDRFPFQQPVSLGRGFSRIDVARVGANQPQQSPRTDLVHLWQLTRPAVATLCLECHTGNGDFGVKTSRGVTYPDHATHSMIDPHYQRCTGCHVAIHGSNVHYRFLR